MERLRKVEGCYGERKSRIITIKIIYNEWDLGLLKEEF